jgi:hypothetical protein
MPSGIELAAPPTGYSGYWPNLFVLLEDDSLVFDLGRKSVPGRTQGLLKTIAKEHFEGFVPFMQYVSSDPPTESALSFSQVYEKLAAFEELKALPDLPIDAVSYRKHPDGQEAGVVALFHELVGKGWIRGYYTLRTGYKMTYDMWALYKPALEDVGTSVRASLDFDRGLPVVIEFKFAGEEILSDVHQNKKYFEDLDLIVCWDLDEAKFKRDGINVSILKPSEVFFHGSNYLLEWPGAYNLGRQGRKPVIALRRFMEDKAKGT